MLEHLTITHKKTPSHSDYSFVPAQDHNANVMLDSNMIFFILKSYNFLPTYPLPQQPIALFNLLNYIYKQQILTSHYWH